MQKPNLIIITKKVGIMGDYNFTVNNQEKRGLANRLWQFSYFLVFAKEHNIFLINPSFSDFTINENDFLSIMDYEKIF